jgi:hypothetical protein
MRVYESYLSLTYPQPFLEVMAVAVGPRLCDHAWMRSRIHSVVLLSEVGESLDEVHRVVLELGRTVGGEGLKDEGSPRVAV